MSMYNLLHGQNPLAGLIISMLDVYPARFRDAWITEDRKIAIYTRLGGGNRDDYQENITQLQSHPNYFYDRDDEFDCTYATFYYSFPEKYKEILEAMPRSGESGDDRWAKKLLEIQTMDVKVMEEKYPALVEIVEKIKKFVEVPDA